jgi:hypothetical protein
MADPTPSPDTTPAPSMPTPGTPAPAAAAQPSGPSTVPAASAPSVLGSEAPAPTYGDFKLPEGAAVDDESLKAASTLFADSGLSQEQAQKFIDLAVSREQAAAQKGVRAFVDLQTKWVSEIKADPDIGGDKFQATLASAARAIDRLDIPGLREALDLTGAGNNPAIVKAFARIGQMISEDRFRPGNGAPPAAAKSPAEVIYGAQPKGSAE